VGSHFFCHGFASEYSQPGKGKRFKPNDFHPYAEVYSSTSPKDVKAAQELFDKMKKF